MTQLFLRLHAAWETSTFTALSLKSRYLFILCFKANRGESQLKNSDDAAFVVKIEPKENGPLFSEIHFYTACAKEEERKIF